MSPEEKELEQLLNHNTSLLDLRSRLGADFHQYVGHLYKWWKTGKLSVLRDWGGLLGKTNAIPYSHNICLLPDDQLQLNQTLSVRTIKIATWNVNSIRARLPLILNWLQKQAPDIVCFQETKVEDHQFPEWDLQVAGYHCVYHGQKTYNGVAILSKLPIDSVKYGFSNGYDEPNKRLIITTIAGINILNVYVPQGQSIRSSKFSYKLDFLQNLMDELRTNYSSESPLVLLGDMNIAPDNRDLTSPEDMLGKVSFHPREHAYLQELRDWGLVDVYRKFHPESGQYTWWDFRTRGFERGDGMRIDHLWATTSFLASCQSCEIDFDNRSQPKPSDHAPVVCVFSKEI